MLDSPSSIFVSVLLPIPSGRLYSYRVPPDIDISIGDFVRVPVASRKLVGIVWRTADAPPDDIPLSKLRTILEKLDISPLDSITCEFIEWVSNYTLAPMGMVLRMVLSSPSLLQPAKTTMGVRFTGLSPSRSTKSRESVMRLSSPDKVWKISDLSRTAGVSSSVIKGLVKSEVLESAPLPSRSLVSLAGDIPPSPDTFTSEQQIAVDELCRLVSANEFSTILLDGITGSGKTEVYFEAIASCLVSGKQVLILLPEIALTSSFLSRFESRFGFPAISWHSSTSASRRGSIWRGIRSGNIQVIVGARSALFLPFDNLGLIVVDEEHDSAYKQEDRVFYHARDMAIVRAMLGKFLCILSSATPSVESRVNALSGRYHHLRLLQRFRGAELPIIESIDLREHPPDKGDFLSPPLRRAITATLSEGKQVLLFLNRRGYAPLTLCRTCGHRFTCSQCSAWLVEHRFRHQLQCHHCGYVQSVPEFCPSCEKPDTLVACGPGVERIADEVSRIFPDARALVLSSDITGGIEKLRSQFSRIESGDVDIIIGTQLIAKGHDYPNICCVGVVDADLSIGSDPRASERTFQLLWQVTGRAGRMGGRSFGYLQTYSPHHPVLQSLTSGNFESFYEQEIEVRRTALLPPFYRLVALLVTGKDLKATNDYARSLKQSAPSSSKARILGPAPAPMPLIRSRHRIRLLLHSPRAFDIQAYVRNWLSNSPKVSGDIRVQVDIDPQSFL